MELNVSILTKLELLTRLRLYIGTYIEMPMLKTSLIGYLPKGENITILEQP